MQDIKDLEKIYPSLDQLSNCGLGTTAGVPIAGILTHFRAEVEAHIKLKVCPSGVCPMNGSLADEINTWRVKIA
jgi:NADP-reducing hydrogenase subunit HndC